MAENWPVGSILNGNYKKGCTNIDSPNHPLLFELLDYVKWLHKWRNQSIVAKNKYLYFADSTHQDTVWCALSLVYSAMKQLPEGHDIVPRRLGSDFLERNFSRSRSKNAHATAQGTDGQLANIGGQTMQNLMQSRKVNTAKQRVFLASDVDDIKAKRRRIN